MTITARADCSPGAGSIFYRHEGSQDSRALVASFGCELQKFDGRARYFPRLNTCNWGRNFMEVGYHW